MDLTKMPDTGRFLLQFDGSCPLNPGPMGIGYTVSQEKSGVLVRVGAQIGPGTNNEAEYRALIAGVQHALRLGMWVLDIQSDSLLVVQQVKGRWKAKDARLRRLRDEALVLLGLLNGWTLNHIRREGNVEADRLSRVLEWEQPSLPPPAMWGNVHRDFHPWQAAAVRVWWREKNVRNTYLLARIFGVLPGSIEQIGNGKSYSKATFEGLPTYSLPILTSGTTVPEHTV
jgi:ribonuclease HI